MILAVGGCTVGTGHDPAQPSSGGSNRASASYQPNSGDVNGKVVPILAYLQYGTPAEIQANNILAARCMAGFGYSSGFPLVQDQVPLAPMYRRYGVTSLAVAKRWGYHPEAGSPLIQTVHRQAPKMSPAEMLVFYGTNKIMGPTSSGAIPEPKPANVGGRSIPAGGCNGQVAREIYGSSAARANPYYLAEKINRDDFRASETNPKVLAAFRDWSKCMASKGFTYSNPNQAMKSFGFSTPGPAPAEIATATADVECKNQTHLVTTWFNVESHLEEASIQKNILALDAIKAQEQAAEKAALGVVSGSGQG